MRNYLILNGNSSSDINGLLIQSLAPISKPLIRTQIEEIDGRDGDIVTPLGYSAYDKTVSIGLYGDYDIDELIAYFNSSGTVIFSNEPEKYYNYQILQAIDFERLIRYRTATVVFHVQPFKYSTSETAKTFNVSDNLLSVNNFSKTTNGVTLTASNGTITVSGTASTATEFYVPIRNLTLGAGSYTLTATTSGTGASAGSIRVIGSVPSDADSFGGGYLGLPNNTSATKTATLTASKTYNYVWFYITAGTAMNYTLNVELENNDSEAEQSLTITNNGNIYSKPKLTLYGTGTVNLSLNGNQIFVINFGESANYLTIDTALMEAYKDNTSNLMNRSIDGDYDNSYLQVGTNTLSWSGTLTQIVIENYSRWL